MQKIKPRIGIQGGVMGWEDPFNPQISEKYMRTGEKQVFKPQDPDTTVKEEFDFIKSIGADFYVHSVMPEKLAVEKFVETMATDDLDYMLNNEYGNINEIFEPNTNRYDVPLSPDINNDKLIGLIYDETEHLQLHPEIYRGNSKFSKSDNYKPKHQWANPDGLGLKQIEDAVTKSVKTLVEGYGTIPIYGEYVFPVMHHILARGGINPCPKIMKEEFSSVQLSTSISAAMQYGRKLGICVDLWGQDVGEWFTRLWGFPGHSPKEFSSALRLAYMMSPDLMYIENIDVLAYNTKNGIMKTEFADVFEEFTKEFIPKTHLNHHHSNFAPEVAIIRSDDTIWRTDGNFNGSGPFGCMDMKPTYKSTSVFEIFNLLSDGYIPNNGITTFLPQFKFPHGEYPRDEESLRKLPLLNGVPKNESSNEHKLFYPLNNLAVYDENVQLDKICSPKLIFLTGSRVTRKCLESIYRACKNGAKAVIADWLVDSKDRISCDKIIYVSNFTNSDVAEIAKEFVANNEKYYMKFGDKTLYIEDSGNGIDLKFNYVER